MKYAVRGILLVVIAGIAIVAALSPDKPQDPIVSDAKVEGSREQVKIGEQAASASAKRSSASRGLAKAVAAQSKFARSPEAKRERAASRTAYRDLASGAALRAVKETQPRSLEEPLWSPPRLQKGEKLEAYTSQTTARIDLANSTRDAIVGSTVDPIAIEKPNGGFVAVDMSLKGDGDGFRPTESAVNARFPSEIGDGVALGKPDSGTIKLDLGESKAQGRVVEGKKVFYGNTSPDVDTILEALPRGAAVSWTLRSPDAAEVLPLEFDGDIDDVELMADGGVMFKADKLGDGEIAPPIAYDAQGTKVPVHYELDGDRVLVRVPHAAKDLAYPIVVDPAINFGGILTYRDDLGLTPEGNPRMVSNNSSVTPFGWATNNGTNMLYSNTTEGSGNRMRIQIRNGARGSAWANLMYDVPNGATIFRVHWSMSDHIAPYYTDARFGIINAGGAWEGQANGWQGPGCPQTCWGGPGFMGNNVGMPQIDVHSCAAGNCGMGGSGDNKALLQYVLSVPSGVQNTKNSYVSSRGAYIYFSDYNAPSMSIGGTGGTAWENRAASTVSATINDNGGVGLGNFDLKDPYGNAYVAKSAFTFLMDDVTQVANGPSCVGGFTNPCPTTHYPSIAQFGVGREGIRTMKFQGSDIVGQTTTDTRVLKTDNSGPDIDLAGRFGTFALEQSTLLSNEPRTVVTNAPFVIRAFDGRRKDAVTGEPARPSERRSGVKSIEAKIHGADSFGNIVTTSDYGSYADTSLATACDTNNYPATAEDSCQLSLTGTFNAESLSPGIYYFRVKAKDWLNQETSKDFKVAVGIASLEQVSEGRTTARYVPVQVKRKAGQTAATTDLQYRVQLNQTWCDVPAAALRPETNFSGSVTYPLPFSSDLTEIVVVDLDALRTIKDGGCNFTSSRLPDGKVYLRAELAGAGTSASRSSEDVVVRYERGGLGTDDDSTPIGPGEVDLVSGNFSMSATDVSVDAYKSDLTISRTYNSRYVDGVTKIGPFGPGWTMGIESESAGSSYTRVIDYASVDLPEIDRYAAVEVQTSDGEFLVFELENNTNVYKSEPGFESLELTRIPDASDANRTAGFKLFDKETGTVARFETRPANAPLNQYEVTDTYAPGSSSAVTYSYALSSVIGTYPTFAFAPSAGIECRAASESSTEAFDTLPQGCQALRFNYEFPGGPRRLGSIDLKNFNPETSSMETRTVARYAYDAQSRLIEAWDPRISPALKTTYTLLSTTDHRIVTAADPGELPHTINYLKLAEDSNYGRLRSVSRPSLLPAPNDVAVWNVRYWVPVHGANAPFDFSVTETGKWGQERPPFMATAVFPPDQLPNGDPATNYDRASMSYLDPFGKEVNSREPGGRITAVEYDKFGNVLRTLGAENRNRAMAKPTPAERLEAAERWDTKNFYDQVPNSPTGRLRLTRTIGPEHEVKLASGTKVQARQETKLCHDEARTPSQIESDSFGSTCLAPGLPVDSESNEPFDLVTSSRTGALVGSNTDGSGGTTHDVRTNAVYYGATESEVKLRVPRLTVGDPGAGNKNVKRKTDFNADGMETVRYQPSSQSETAPTTNKTFYYEKDATSECPAKPEWRGLPCKMKPGGQPTTAGLPKLPERTFTYNYLRQPLTSTETVVDSAGVTQTRTNTSTYDVSGRPLTEEVTGTVGQSVKKTRHVFNTTNGEETQTQSLNADGSVAKTITRSFDTLGRQVTYTDAEGNGSSVLEFDILSRPRVTNDGIANRTRTYDAITGDLIGLVDAGIQTIGSFSATYNHDGQIVSESLPAFLVKTHTYDTTGKPTQLTYTRDGATWMDNKVDYNIFSQVAGQTGLPTQTGATTSQLFDYDRIGRLSEVRDTSAAQCTIRQYVLDDNSNRTNMKTFAPGAGGACDPSATPSERARSYDDADRSTLSGYVYDAFGRTTTVPQADAGGSGSMVASYFVNDLARSVTQDGLTQTIELDPNMRMSQRTKSGSSSGTDIYAYTDDSDSPAYIKTGTNWTRYIDGIDGSIAAIHPSSGASRWAINNIRGDTVAEAQGGGLENIREIDEFGVVKNNLPASRPYGFHGSDQREALTSSGIVAMGVRLYAPRAGRFLQVDPVLGGSDNPYDFAYQDPLNIEDLDGRCPLCAAGLYIGGAAALRIAARHVGKQAAKKAIKNGAKKTKRAKKDISYIKKRNKKLKSMGRPEIKGGNDHFWKRMKERNVSYDQINKTMLEGEFIGRGKGGVNYGYRHNGVTVWISPKGILQTTWKKASDDESTATNTERLIGA